jgi:SulP family sulfate permease
MPIKLQFEQTGFPKAPPEPTPPRRSQLLVNLWVGLISGIISLFKSISLAALIFTGGLSSYMGVGVGVMLLSNVIIRLITGLTCSYPVTMINPQAQQVAILGLIAAVIQTQLAGSAPSEQVFVTVIGAIALTTILTGIFCLLLGILRVGGLIRFIPYPVVSGFLAGTGLLLVQGAFKAVTDVPLTFTNLPLFGQPDYLVRWLPIVGIAIALLLLTRRYGSSLILPLGCLSIIGGFYLVLGLTQTSIQAAIAQGWLLGDFPQQMLWQTFDLSVLQEARWGAVFDQFGSMGIVMVLTALTVLLSVSGMELAVDSDINVNQDLRSTGFANIVSGFVGGLPGTHSLSSAVMAYKMGGRSRLVSLAPVTIFAMVLWLGPRFMAYFPTLLIGSILLYLGLDLLVERLYDGWFELPRSDYFTVALIVIAVGIFGFLEAVGIGLVMTIILFVINYSRVNVTKHILSGANYSSKVVRPRHQERFLYDAGDQIYILELQGFIFFGTASQLLTQIRQRIADPERTSLKFMILDFRLVTGLDSSAILNFVKLRQLASKTGFTLIFTALSPSIHAMLERGHVLIVDDQRCQTFANLDQGVEWCESEILAASTWRRSRFTPMALQLKKLFPDEDLVGTFMGYLERLTLEPGDCLFRVGDRADAVYFVESGQIKLFKSGCCAPVGEESAAKSENTESNAGSASDLASTPLGYGELAQPSPDSTSNSQNIKLGKINSTFLLRTLGAGTIFGEIAFYRVGIHHTCAISDQDSTVYRLTRAKLRQLQQEQPEVAVAFGDMMMMRLAEKLAQAQEEISILMS